MGSGAKRKGPSKMIRIVDPSTMEELDVTVSGGGGSGSGTTATAPAAVECSQKLPLSQGSFF